MAIYHDSLFLPTFRWVVDRFGKEKRQKIPLSKFEFVNLGIEKNSIRKITIGIARIKLKLSMCMCIRCAGIWVREMESTKKNGINGIAPFPLVTSSCERSVWEFLEILDGDLVSSSFMHTGVVSFPFRLFLWPWTSAVKRRKTERRSEKVEGRKSRMNYVHTRAL